MADLIRCGIRLPVSLMAFAALSIAGGCSQAPRPSAVSEDATRAKLALLSEPSGNVDNQLSLLAAAASHEPNNTAIQIRYASALADAGRKQDALTVAEQVYSRDNKPMTLGLLIGRLHLQMDHGSAATAAYQEILTREPSNNEALNGLGIAEVIQGALAAAEADFRRAVAIAPTNPESRNNLALALSLEQRTGEAIPMLRDLLRENNTSRPVRINLALAYVVSGDRGKAVETLTPVMAASEIDTTLETYARLGRTAPPANAQGVRQRLTVSDNASRVDEVGVRQVQASPMAVVAAAIKATPVRQPDAAIRTSVAELPLANAPQQ